MSRETKFRAWQEEEKKMWVDVGIDDGGSAILDTHIGFAPLKGSHIIMQYTGLLDKQGKEIYEGDVLAHNSKDAHDNTYQIRYEVKFGEYDNGKCYDDNISGCGWWLKRFILIRSNGEIDSEIQVYDYRGLHGLENSEVIGNIYENKELLEER